MALLLQVLITGLAAGAVYGLIAVGISLLYRLTGVVHLAIGEVVGLSVFVALAVIGGAGPATGTDPGVASFLLSVGVAAAVAVGVGLVSYLLAVRPFLSRGWSFGWIGGLLALAFAIRGLIQASFTRASYVFPDPIGFDRLADGGVIRLGGGVTVQVRAFAILAAAALLAALAVWVLLRTDVGRGLQAIAGDRLAARASGLPVERMVAGAFAAVGVFAVVAALAQAPAAPVSADTGALLGLKALVAAMLAGFGSPWRVLGAGLALGVVESGVATAGVLGPAFRDVIPLALVLAALFVRPSRTEAAWRS